MICVSAMKFLRCFAAAVHPHQVLERSRARLVFSPFPATPLMEAPAKVLTHERLPGLAFLDSLR